MDFLPAYRKANDVVKRLSRAQEVMKKWPGRIPVILDRQTAHSPEIKQNRYMVPKEITVAQFMFTIRKQMKALKPEQSICLFIYEKNVLPVATQTMGDVYHQHRDAEDNFLYMTYSVENCFGG
jgi:GABA(A) receptor-associated protein